MFFAKPTFEEFKLPFKFIDDSDYLETGIFSIEAYGDILGQMRYCYASYVLKNNKMYDNGEYEQIINLLKNSDGKTIKVTFKIKKGVAKDFEIDLFSLAEAYNDERFKSLDLIGRGLNKISCID